MFSFSNKTIYALLAKITPSPLYIFCSCNECKCVYNMHMPTSDIDNVYDEGDYQGFFLPYIAFSCYVYYIFIDQICSLNHPNQKSKPFGHSPISSIFLYLYVTEIKIFGKILIRKYLPRN